MRTQGTREIKVTENEIIKYICICISIDKPKIGNLVLYTF